MNRFVRPALSSFCLVLALGACGRDGTGTDAESAPPAAAAEPVSDPRNLAGIWWNERSSVADLEIVGEPPRLTQAGEAKLMETSALKREIDAAVSDPKNIRNCIVAGVPRVWGQPYPMEIAQKPDVTVLMYEHMHSFRIVSMDRAPFTPDDVVSLHRFGHSVGRWEGDTLVIESTAFNGLSVLDEKGLPSSEQLHTIERLRKIDDQTLEVMATIEDPDYYAAPWTVRTVLKRQPADAVLMEYTCGYGVYETRYTGAP